MTYPSPSIIGRGWLFAGTIGLAASAGSALAQDDWCKSKWGPQDEIGAANILTPQMA